MSIFAKRRERILSLASGFDSVVVTNPKNLFYLTDFWGGGTAIVKRDETVVVTSVMEEQRANEFGREVRIVPTKGMAGLGAVKDRVEGKVLTDQYDPNIKGKVDGSLFLEARRRKDAEEVRRIAEGSKRVERLYRLLENEIGPGRSERAIAAEVMRLAIAEGLSPLAAEGSLSPIIIASGPNAALPHAELSERRIRPGDLVVADLFFRYRGYCTDCTRTYGVGKVSKERRDGYEAVLEAQLRGIELTKSGAISKEIHAGVNSVLRERGLANFFTHGTGHGVGIDIHERPSIGSSSDDALADGDVVTIEPGIYVPGRYGVRIEDTLVVGEESRDLYEYTKELLVL